MIVNGICEYCGAYNADHYCPVYLRMRRGINGLISCWRPIGTALIENEVEEK